MSKTTTAKALGLKENPQGVIDAEEVFATAATDPANQEIEVFQAPDGSQWRRRLVDHELMAWVAMQANHNNGEDVDAGMRMFAQVAEAETLGDVLSGKVETVKSRDILDTPLACLSIKFMNGDQGDGCPYFAILEVRYGAKNEKETISIGGWYAIAQLARLHYQSADFPPESHYLTAEAAPNSLPKESYPHYFRIKTKETPKGHMNYLAPAV